MKSKHKTLVRVVLFSLVFVLLFSFANSFFQPAWSDWNNYYTTNGFYEEPKQTIETLFLGASIVTSGVTPMELYDNFGMCSYNLATEQQPMLGSYYWLEEVYRLHSETLKTVVLDVSAVRSGSKESFYHKALDSMKFSSVKLRAVRDHVGNNLEDILSFLLPIVAYHDRWSSIDETDFAKYSYDADKGTRGYYFIKKSYSSKSSEEIVVKDTVLDENAEPDKLKEDSLYYLEQIVNFCEEKGLNLLLIKTPANNWSSSLHNAVVAVAEELGATFIDLNYSPVYDELNYIHLYDSADGKHVNYYGASKVTKWLGNYIVKEFGATDVRGLEKYAHMEEQLVEYNTRVTQNVNLRESTDVSEYLEVALSEDNTVFIEVKYDCSKSLTSQQRAYFASIGLEKASEIGWGDSYLAVIENGNVLYEEIKAATDSEDAESISYSGKLKNGKSYTISSGGINHGTLASCVIDGTEQAKNACGWNITVYSNTLNEVIDNAAFDTSTSAARECYRFDMCEDSAAEIYSSNSIFQKVQQYQNSVEDLKNKTLAEKAAAIQ